MFLINSILFTVFSFQSAQAITSTCALKDIANDFFNRSDCQFSRRISGSVTIGGVRGQTIEFRCSGTKKILIIRRGGYTCTANQVLMDMTDVANEAEGLVEGSTSDGVN